MQTLCTDAKLLVKYYFGNMTVFWDLNLQMLNTVSYKNQHGVPCSAEQRSSMGEDVDEIVHMVPEFKL